MNKRKVVWTSDRGGTHSLKAEEPFELVGIYKGLLEEALNGKIKSFKEIEEVNKSE